MSTIEKRLDELERRVDDVVARDAIRELTAEYCRQVMRGDTQGAVSLFTDDASLLTHFPDESGQDNVGSRGRAELLEAYDDLGAMSLKPFIHNHIIELEGRASPRLLLRRDPADPGRRAPHRCGPLRG